MPRDDLSLKNKKCRRTTGLLGRKQKMLSSFSSNIDDLLKAWKTFSFLIHDRVDCSPLFEVCKYYCERIREVSKFMTSTDPVWPPRKRIWTSFWHSGLRLSRNGSKTKLHQWFDLWNIGVLVYRLVDGKAPFKAGSHEKTYCQSLPNKLQVSWKSISFWKIQGHVRQAIAAGKQANVP